MKALASLALLGLLACGEPRAAGRPVMVFAAASLSAPFRQAAREFERRHGCQVELHFAGTPRLVLQLREGAPADVFASADVRNMDRVVEAGLVRSPVEVFAHNRLAIAVGRGNPNGIRGLSDLAREDLKVALCGPAVPAGRYARQSLERAAVELRSVSDEPSVKAVVNKIRLGELDAGIVYVTDLAAMEGVEAVPIPDRHNVFGTYPIASLWSGDNPTLGREFAAFVLSPPGRAILRSFGFSVP